MDFCGFLLAPPSLFSKRRGRGMSWFKNSPVPSLGSKRGTFVALFHQINVMDFCGFLLLPLLFFPREGGGGMSWFRNSPVPFLCRNRGTYAVFGLFEILSIGC